MKIVLTAIQQADTIKESFVAQLAIYLLKGLKSKNLEYKCTSYMILAALCNKVCGMLAAVLN